MVPEPAKKSRMVALCNVVTVVDNKNLTKPEGLGNAKGLI